MNPGTWNPRSYCRYGPSALGSFVPSFVRSGVLSSLCHAVPFLTPHSLTPATEGTGPEAFGRRYGRSEV